jgi:hypothetical protein
MGFWGSFAKIMAGKPVYDDTSVADKLYPKPQAPQPGVQAQRTTFTDGNGNKIVPEVSFKHFKSHVNGSKVQTWAWAVNDSSLELELMKTELLGHHQDIHRRLRPGESHEIMIYSGPLITHEHDHQARLYYKIHENDDGFLAEYNIEYTHQSDGTFVVEEFHRTYQPRDI